VVFSFVHPLADSDLAERTQARQDTPTAEALDFLANPDAPPPPKRPSFAEWLAVRPQWEGPPTPANDPDDDDDGPRPDLFAQADAQYIRDTFPERSTK
jgi:hypothetical protein